MTKTKKAVLSISGLVVLLAAVFTIRIASYTPAPGASRTAPDDALGNPWRGAVHVHSTFSDGAAVVDEIMAAAAAAGIDFVILSDHNPLGPQQRPRPGWYGDVLLIVGEEISTYEGHLLALQVMPHRYRFGPSARQALADIADEGGWALVAHADHSRQAWSGGWGGTQGLEVANLSSAWSRSTVLSAAAVVGSAFIDRDYAAAKLLSSGWPTLSLWDALTELSARPVLVRRPRVAVGAADAHGPLLGPLPSYDDTIGVLNTVVWIDEPADGAPRLAAESVESKLLAALRAGRAVVETTALGDGRSFTFSARSPSGSVAMGDFAASEDGPWALHAGLPSAVDVELVVLRDGRPVAQAEATSINMDVAEPGTYRVEVYRQGAPGDGAVPWIVSNPIYFWPAEARLGSRLFRAPPLPPPPPGRDLLPEAEFQANQRGVPFNTVATGDSDASWSFALAADSAPDAFAAMVWPADEVMNWSGDEGLIVGIAAAHPMRTSIELQTIAADGTPRTWAYSLKAGPETPDVAIPWGRFQPPWSNDLSAGGADEGGYASAREMERVEGVFLVVTPMILAPGSSVTLRLRRLALY